MELTYKKGMAPMSNIEIKAALTGTSTLYFKEFTFANETIAQLVLKFGELSYRNNTLDAASDRVMCTASRKRSFCDLYRFIIHHRPRATVKTVKDAVRNAILAGDIYPTYCEVIKRGVFLYKPHQIGAQHPPTKYKERLTYNTEFGMTIGEFYDLN